MNIHSLTLLTKNTVNGTAICIVMVPFLTLKKALSGKVLIIYHDV